MQGGGEFRSADERRATRLHYPLDASLLHTAAQQIMHVNYATAQCIYVPFVLWLFRDRVLFCCHIVTGCAVRRGASKRPLKLHPVLQLRDDRSLRTRTVRNRLVLPLPHACLREHMTVSRTRCRPSLVHACDRLPVATGRRRLALLRCGARCACAFPRVSRHASSAAAEGACARGCARHGATRPTRWARARAAGSCSLLLPTVATDAGALRRELSAPASPHAPPTPPSSSC